MQLVFFGQAMNFLNNTFSQLFFRIFFGNDCSSISTSSSLFIDDFLLSTLSFSFLLSAFYFSFDVSFAADFFSFFVVDLASLADCFATFFVVFFVAFLATFFAAFFVDFLSTFFAVFFVDFLALSLPFS